MSFRDSAPLGAPCWVDVFTSDPDAAQAFYGELFGWESETAGPEYGGYFNFSSDGRRVAGGMRNDGQSGTPDSWSIYLTSADARATAQAVTDHGGQVIVPPMEVMALGTMAVVTDAGQAAIGIWQPGDHTGFQVLAQPNAPAWFELQTRAYDDSVGFYRDVFGWDTYTVSDSPEFRYTTLGEGEDQQAGIMDAAAHLPDDVPAHWSVYFNVQDADTALERVVELGGSVLEPAMDTPYGRLAKAADTTGAVFKLQSA
jgi:predicted enzyme related to lactoylglutathione lyase